MRALRTLTLAGVAAVALAGVASGLASADPSSTPVDNSIVAVGSDTIQTLADNWSTDYDATSPTVPFYSYDAFGTGLASTITPKAGCSSITRPNGSSAGINELNNNTTVVGSDGNTYHCVDVARASRAYSSDTADVFVLFAHDSITWAANSTTNATVSLNASDLTNIYSANTGSCVKWTDVGGTSSDTIVPVLPQAGSGTRSQFLKDLGITTVGTCVTNADGSQAIEENEGTNAVFTGSNSADVIYPFSVGSYICQADLGHCTNNTGSLTLQQIGGVAPTTGSGTSTTINTSFPATFIRPLSLVARYTGTSTAPIPSYLTTFLGQGDNTGWICGSTAQADVTAQGFLGTSSTCGSVTHA